MAKYLIQGSYTAEGTKGLLKDGGSKRRAAVKAAVEKLGGRLESFYFGFGKDDFHVILDMPDTASAAALSLTVAASGAVTSQTTVLLTPEDIDAAAQKSVNYRPPGA